MEVGVYDASRDQWGNGKDGDTGDWLDQSQQHWHLVAYRVFSLILPLEVLVCLFILRLIETSVPTSHVFFRMVQLKNRTLYCYSVPLGQSPEAHKILRSMRRVLRYLTFFCLVSLWCALVLETVSTSEAHALTYVCPKSKSWDCYRVGGPYWLAFLGTENGPNFCPSDRKAAPPEPKNPLSPVLCYRTLRPKHTTMIMVLGAMSGLTIALLMGYQGATWMIFKDRSEHRINIWICCGVAAILWGYWLLDLVSQMSRYGSFNWLEGVLVPVVPLILHEACLTALQLRRRCQKLIYSKRDDECFLSRHAMFTRRSEQQRQHIPLSPSECADLDKATKWLNASFSGEDSPSPRLPTPSTKAVDLRHAAKPSLTSATISGSTRHPGTTTAATSDDDGYSPKGIASEERPRPLLLLAERDSPKTAYELRRAKVSSCFGLLP